MNLPWLTILLALPILGSLVLTVLPARENSALPKQLALGISVLTLALGVALAIGYESGGGYQYEEDVVWIKLFGAHYALGLDGIGLALVLLTVILTPVVILASWNDGDHGTWGAKGFFAWILALEGLSIGVFAATDVFLFYVFFEATLIPVYFLVAGYGGPQRVRAAVKFLLYSLFGGLVMLASVIGLYVESAKTEGGPTYLVSELAKIDFGTDVGRWLFLGFFIAFAIKAPMFPVHTWLPDTAESATPGTSVLLVSVLDKIGTFGMIRFCLELFPEASKWATPVVVVLAIFSILYGAVMAIGSLEHPAPDRVLVGEPLRLHRAGHLRDEQPGPLGREPLHVQPRPLHGRAVPGHGLPDQAAGLCADRRLRRCREGGAGARRAVPGLRPVRGLAARPVAVRLRAARDGRCVRALALGRVVRGARHRAGRDLHPVDVPAHHDRTRCARVSSGCPT